MSGRPLPASFYARETATVARELLGALIVSTLDGRRCVARIVETEAYVGPHDPACHGAGGRRTRRNAALFGPPGTAYVFFTYGMHFCLNLVTERSGFPAAVLLRAAEPLEGLAVMRARRGGVPDRELASGPAKLAQALAVGRECNGHPLGVPPLAVLRGRRVGDRLVVRAPRIGVRRASDWPLRFYLRGNPFVSRPHI